MVESPVLQTTRRERRRTEVRDRILDAARVLFDERGYDDTKVSDICDRADLAYGTFFNHFGEKRDYTDAEALVNMIVYIKGEELLYELESEIYAK